jgi:hypothetical protein
VVDGLAGDHELVAADRDNQYQVSEAPIGHAAALAR